MNFSLCDVRVALDKIISDITNTQGEEIDHFYDDEQNRFSLVNLFEYLKETKIHFSVSLIYSGDMRALSTYLATGYDLAYNVIDISDVFFRKHGIDVDLHNDENDPYLNIINTYNKFGNRRYLLEIPFLKITFDNGSYVKWKLDHKDCLLFEQHQNYSSSYEVQECKADKDTKAHTLITLIASTPLKHTQPAMTPYTSGGDTSVDEIIKKLINSGFIDESLCLTKTAIQGLVDGRYKLFETMV